MKIYAVFKDSVLLKNIFVSAFSTKENAEHAKITYMNIDMECMYRIVEILLDDLSFDERNITQNQTGKKYEPRK